MERLDSLNPGLALTAAGTQQSLTAKGMPRGRCVDKFFLKLNLTLVRGAAALTHLPQAISEIVNRLTISHGRISWNVQGRIVHLFDMIQRLSVNSMSAQLQAADTAYTFYLPIDPSPVGPPFNKPNLFRTEDLQNCIFDLVLVNPFDAVNDVTALTADIELWATYREVPKNGVQDWVSVFRQQDNFQGNTVSISDMVPALWIGLGESPTNFDLVTIESSGVRIARGANMIDLDARDYYYQPISPSQYQLFAAGVAFDQGGNQFLRNVPRANAAAENYHKVFDSRNDRAAALPIVAAYNTIPVPFGYAIKGVSL